jgi:hypothetical protein
MGCGKHDKKKNSCVCDAVVAIKDQQDAVDECPTSCFTNLLSPAPLGDTIPFVLTCDCDDTFTAVGNVGELSSGSCFTTEFFRVESVDEDSCCATLSLLRPLKKNGHPAKDECDVHSLMRTNFCVEVDLDCFCAIQCLDPRLVDREVDC